MKLLGREIDFRDILQQLIFGGSFGGGMFLVYELISREPRMVIETFRSWGPLSMFCLVGLVMVDRGFRNIIQATQASSAAQQRLADAVGEIAKRDDTEAYQQRVLMGHVATQTETILTRFEQLERRLDEAERVRTQARGAGAI